MSILILELIGLLCMCKIIMIILIIIIIIIIFFVENIPKEVKAFINYPWSSALHNKNIITNIFRIQAYDLIMCGYFCIGFIDFMLAGKTLTEYTNLFSPNNFDKNDSIILNYLISHI